jgi:mycothiol synthase
MTDTEIKRAGLPYGFTLRRPTLDDLAAVRHLINVCEIAEYGVADTSENDMRLRWQRPDFNLVTDVWNVLAPDGQIVASIAVGNRQHVRVQARTYVHPDYQKRGIGTCLLGLAEERARQHIPLAPDGARVVLVGKTNSVNVTGQKLLEKHGFSAIRNFWRMGIELQETPPLAQWPEGITVRTLPTRRHSRIIGATLQRILPNGLTGH